MKYIKRNKANLARKAFRHLIFCEPSFNTNGQRNIKLLIVLGGHCKEKSNKQKYKSRWQVCKAFDVTQAFKEPFQSYTCWKWQI